MVTGGNFFKKIPIGAGKIGYTMVPKNQNIGYPGLFVTQHTNPQNLLQHLIL